MLEGPVLRDAQQGPGHGWSSPGSACSSRTRRVRPCSVDSGLERAPIFGEGRESTAREVLPAEHSHGLGRTRGRQLIPVPKDISSLVFARAQASQLQLYEHNWTFSPGHLAASCSLPFVTPPEIPKATVEQPLARAKRSCTSPMGSRNPLAQPSVGLWAQLGRGTLCSAVAARGARS